MHISCKLFAVLLSLPIYSSVSKPLAKDEPVDFIIQWAKLNKLKKIKQFEKTQEEKKKPINWDTRDNQGKTPLMHAVINGNDQIVIYLLEKGVDASLTDRYGNTALKLAQEAKETKKELAEKYTQQIIPALLNKTKTKDGQTLLTQTIENGIPQSAIDIIDLLGADINKPNGKGQTPLHVAVLRRDDNTTNKLLKQCVIKVDAQDNEGNTALHYATARGDFQIVKALTNAGALATLRNKNIKTPRDIVGSRKTENVDGRDIKAIRQHLEEIERNPINIKVAQQDCENPIIATCAAGSIDPKCIDGRKKKQEAIAKEQERAAWAQFDQLSRESLLTKAACSGQLENIVKVLEAGAPINALDGNGNTALIAAIKCYRTPINGYNHPAVIEYLLKKGASILIHDKDGKNPLHYAVEFENMNIVNLLLQSLEKNSEKLVILDAEDRNGDTAIDYALAVTNYDLVKRLFENGATPHIINTEKEIVIKHLGTKQSVSDHVRENLAENLKKIRQLFSLESPEPTESAAVHKIKAQSTNASATQSDAKLAPQKSSIAQDSEFTSFDQPFKD